MAFRRPGARGLSNSRCTRTPNRRFGYIRPNFKLPNRTERVVLYEPFTDWPGVSERSCSRMNPWSTSTNKAHFEKLLKEARSARNPTSRPNE